MGSPINTRLLLFGVCLVSSAALGAASGCGDDAGDPVGQAAHADVVVDALTAETAVAMLAINGVRGGGGNGGSTDVLELGFADGVDNAVTLRWSGRRVVDGPGPDFVVFENAFGYGAGSRFMDLVVVEVSRDGQRWARFPHDFKASDETRYSSDPADWVGFAGRQPVLFHEEGNRVDPFAHALAGGDAFDLASLPAGEPEPDLIRAEGFRYLRLVTAPSLTNPDTGAPFVRDAASNGADIDGVYARYFAEDSDVAEN